MIDLCIISDTHGLHNDLEKKFELPNADILIHCGDVSNVGYEHDVRNFLEWFGNLRQYPYKIFIAGNHDFLFENNKLIVQELISETQEKYSKNGEIHYLEDSGVNIWGLNFWGIPVTKPFNNWAFNRPEDKLQQHWENIPDNTDVLITHGPPYNILDFISNKNEHTGSESLKDNILNRIKPKIHCFGHIHNQYGATTIDNIKFINASNLNDNYRFANPPILLGIE